MIGRNGTVLVNVLTNRATDSHASGSVRIGDWSSVLRLSNGPINIFGSDVNAVVGVPASADYDNSC